MAELIGAVGQEYRKLGRLILESEFGPYLRLAGSTAALSGSRVLPSRPRLRALPGGARRPGHSRGAAPSTGEVSHARTPRVRLRGVGPPGRRPAIRPSSASTTRLDVRRPRAPAGPTCSAASGMLGLQRAVGNAAVGALLEEERSPVHGVVNSGGGTPLAPDVRTDMEARLGGHDFGDVRVHTDGAAHESATVGERARVHGRVEHRLPARQLRPGVRRGQHMLAHELTHVVQQRSGPVDGTDQRRRGEGQRPVGPVRAGGRRQRRPADDHPGRSRSGRRRARRPRAAGGRARGARASRVQRAEEMSEEDESAQTYVQRQEAPEEEEEPAE